MVNVFKKILFSQHKIDFVMHFAASKNVSESVHDPFHYYHNNLIGTLNLFDVSNENMPGAP